MRILLLSFISFMVLFSCNTKKSTVLRSPSSVTGSVNNVDKAVSSREPVKSSSGNKTNNVSLSGVSYIERYKDIAILEMNRYGIPASIKLAQALLESGNGNSSLATQANNHFGIKCGGTWSGKSVTKSDDNPNDCFRVYDFVEESYRDHSQFLLRKRYEKLFLLDRDDYKGWAKGLKDAGYATNPRYPELLINLIERYELYQYDRPESRSKKHEREVKVEAIIEQKSPISVKVEQEIKAPVAMVIHEVKPSQTLYGISKQYNVTVEQIKLFNNLTSDTLSIGQLLIVSK